MKHLVAFSRLFLVLMSLSMWLPIAALADSVNGQHDFDFEVGTWNITSPNMPTGRLHLVREVWDGGASLAELEDTLPTPHFDGLMLRLYDPHSHQWRVYWGSRATGILDAPLIGHFDQGRGVFYGRDTRGHTSIDVRVVYSDITPTSFRTEESFSSDGRKTWHVQLVQAFTRIARDAHDPRCEYAPAAAESCAHTR